MGRFDALTQLDTKPLLNTPLPEKAAPIPTAPPPTDQRASKPANPQTDLHAKMQTGKPASMQRCKQVNLQACNLVSRLTCKRVRRSLLKSTHPIYNMSIKRN